MAGSAGSSPPAAVAAAAAAAAAPRLLPRQMSKRMTKRLLCAWRWRSPVATRNRCVAQGARLPRRLARARASNLSGASPRAREGALDTNHARHNWQSGELWLTRLLRRKDPLAASDRQRAQPGLDFFLKDTTLKQKDPWVQFYPSRKNAGGKYEKLRHTWCLLKRKRPVVPCPENTPLPSSKISSEQRSVIYSVYFRYWTFFPDAASKDVVHITKLNLTMAQLSEKNVKNATHRNAWKDFLKRVPPTSYEGIRNVMMACIAEGRNFDRSDTMQDGAGRGQAVTCSISIADINDSLKTDRAISVSSEESAQAQRKKMYMASQLKTATEIMKIQQKKLATIKSKEHRSNVSERHMHLSDYAADKDEEDDALHTDKTSVEIYLHNIDEAYDNWRQNIMRAEITPNVQQWLVLDLVHHDACTSSSKK